MSKLPTAAEMGHLQDLMQKRIQKFIQKEVNKFQRDTGGIFVREFYIGSHEWFTGDGEGVTIGPVTCKIRLP